MKETDSCNEVLIEASGISPLPPLGFAIEALETKLASKGVILQLPERQSGPAEVAAKLLCLASIIHIGIVNAFGGGKDGATESSVGSQYTCQKELVPGNIVALYDSHQGKFLRLFDGKVNYGGGCKHISGLPLKWDSERFLVVDAGGGSVAFFSPSHRQFIGYKDGILSGTGPIGSTEDRPRANESFRLVHVQHFTSSDCVSLYCPIEKKTIGSFQVVQVFGFE